MAEQRPYLLVDALEVHQPGVPELELDPGQGVQPIQQGLRRVFAQNVPDLMGPVDDDGLDGVQEGVVQRRGDPAEHKVGTMPAWSQACGVRRALSLLGRSPSNLPASCWGWAPDH